MFTLSEEWNVIVKMIQTLNLCFLLDLFCYTKSSIRLPLCKFFSIKCTFWRSPQFAKMHTLNFKKIQIHGFSLWKASSFSTEQQKNCNTTLSSFLTKIIFNLFSKCQCDLFKNNFSQQFRLLCYTQAQTEGKQVEWKELEIVSNSCLYTSHLN